ncbi:hypothetical protein AYI70_g7493 [Smittium culicis]|uniref:Uncharacterized protein n=1 Tax=Smittium culicis TaxID=133412 RepID=A0A1R1XKH4_9FUNG|nr:hypothetical protein AYI70_g7493 [Smittium culicis]
MSRSSAILESFGRAFNISSKNKGGIKIEELNGGIKSHSISGAICRSILQPSIGTAKTSNINEIHGSNASITLSSLEETENQERSYDFNNSSTFEIDVKSFPRSTSRRFQLDEIVGHREIAVSIESETQIQKSDFNGEKKAIGIHGSNINSEGVIAENCEGIIRESQNIKTEFPLSKEGYTDASIDEAKCSASIINDCGYETDLLNHSGRVVTVEGIDHISGVNEDELDLQGEESQSEPTEVEFTEENSDVEANRQQEQIYSIEEVLHETRVENLRSVQVEIEDEGYVIDEEVQIGGRAQRNRNFRVIESDFVNSSSLSSGEELEIQTRESNPSREFYHITSQHNRITNPEHILNQDFNGYGETSGFGRQVYINRDGENIQPAINRVAYPNAYGDSNDTSALTPEHIISQFDRILRPSQHSELRQSRGDFLERLYNSTFEQSTSAFSVPVTYASVNSDISRRS